MRFYQQPPAGRGHRQHRGSLIRSLRTGDVDVSVACGDEVGVTVELNDGFSYAMREGGGLVRHVGALGNVAIDPPGRSFDLSVRGECRVVQLAVPVALLSAIAGEDHGLDAAQVRLRASRGRPDRQLMRLVCRAATRPEGEAEDEVLREVVAHLLLRHSEGRAAAVSLTRAGLAPERLRRVRDLVTERLRDVTVADMAAEAALSPFHFAREFKRTTGESPWEYVVNRRVDRVVSLLPRAELTLLEVARAAGFADASHMSHRVRDRVGCSPTALRKHLLP